MQLGMSSKSTLSEQARFPDDETGEIAKRFAKFTGDDCETGKS